MSGECIANMIPKEQGGTMGDKIILEYFQIASLLKIGTITN